MHLSLKRLSGKLLSRSLDRVRQAELCSDKGRSLLRPPGFVLAIGFVGLVLGLFLGLAPMIQLRKAVLAGCLRSAWLVGSFERRQRPSGRLIATDFFSCRCARMSSILRSICIRILKICYFAVCVWRNLSCDVVWTGALDKAPR